MIDILSLCHGKQRSVDSMGASLPGLVFPSHSLFLLCHFKVRLIIFQAYFCYCLSFVHKCDDPSCS